MKSHNRITLLITIAAFFYSCDVRNKVDKAPDNFIDIKAYFRNCFDNKYNYIIVHDTDKLYYSDEKFIIPSAWYPFYKKDIIKGSLIWLSYSIVIPGHENYNLIIKITWNNNTEQIENYFNQQKAIGILCSNKLIQSCKNSYIYKSNSSNEPYRSPSITGYINNIDYYLVVNNTIIEKQDRMYLNDILENSCTCIKEAINIYYNNNK